MSSISTLLPNSPRSGDSDPAADARLEKISNELDRVSNSKKTTGNIFEPMIDGENVRSRLLSTLEAAQSSITYETFEFDDDVTGNLVADALIAAKRRGVDVKVVADAVGSGDFLGKHNPVLQKLKDAGVALRRYEPIEFSNCLTKLNFHRDHRKTVVVDGKTAWIGGMNTGDAYLGAPGPYRAHDVFVSMQGPAVQDMISNFASSWDAAEGGGSRTPAVEPPARETPSTGPTAGSQALLTESPGTETVRIVQHTPRQDTNIRDTYLTLINNAQTNINIENDYPLSAELEHALEAAARRGVEVHYIVGSVGSSHLYTESRFPALLAAGVHIHQYPGRVHVKAASFDKMVAMVGSSNVDVVSLDRNREDMAVVEDPAFAKKFDAELFDRDVISDHQGHPTTTISYGSISIMPWVHKLELWFKSVFMPSSFQ